MTPELKIKPLPETPELGDLFEKAIQLQETYLPSDWHNVVRHESKEVPRAVLLGQMLGVSDVGITNLFLGVYLHDYYKKEERDMVEAGNKSWESFEEAAKESERILGEQGFNEQVIRIAGAVGHLSLNETQTILEKEEPLTEDDLVFLIAHYVDDAAKGHDWSSKNVLEERMAGLKQNTRYAELNKHGQKLWGMTTFEKQAELAFAVEERLKDNLRQKGALPSEVKDTSLANFLDTVIQHQYFPNFPVEQVQGAFGSRIDHEGLPYNLKVERRFEDNVYEDGSMSMEAWISAERAYEQAVIKYWMPEVSE